MNNYDRRRRSSGFPFDFPLDVDGFFHKVEKTFESTLNKTLSTINLKKEDGKLIATLDVPGVAKENVTVRFEELEHGFTRLIVTTSRDGVDKTFKSEFRETVTANKATAVVELGVLTIEVPLKQDDVKNSTEVKIS